MARLRLFVGGTPPVAECLPSGVGRSSDSRAGNALAFSSPHDPGRRPEVDSDNGQKIRHPDGARSQRRGPSRICTGVPCLSASWTQKADHQHAMTPTV